MSSGSDDSEFLFLPRLINGGIAGLVGTLIIFPLEVVKTRLQSQPVKENGELVYKSLIDASSRIFRQEGYKGLYRGLAINLALIIPEIGLQLSSNDLFRNLLHTEVAKTFQEPLSLPRQMLAGAATGMVSVLITSPMELFKIRMQDEAYIATRMKRMGYFYERMSTTAVLVELFQERGFLGIYKGLGTCTLRDVIFSLLFFPGFSVLHNAGPLDIFGDTPDYWTLLSGVVAGGAASWLTTPFDVVKTRLQTALPTSSGFRYTGIIDCFQRTYSTEGYLAFFKGGACRVMVLAPFYGIMELVYYFGVAERVLDVRRQRFVN